MSQAMFTFRVNATNWAGLLRSLTVDLRSRYFWSRLHLPQMGKRMSGARPLPLNQARGPSREQALAVGRALHVARVARGIDLATVARDLLIPRRDLEALEEGDFGRVAGRVRPVALLRAYGNYPGVDGTEPAGPGKAEVDRLDPPPAPERPAPAGGRRRGVVLAAAALLLAGGAAYGALHRPAPAAPA